MPQVEALGAKLSIDVQVASIRKDLSDPMERNQLRAHHGLRCPDDLA
jgi:hypothetical protein